MRSDGVPLYNFGAVVDDVTMGITLVARGRDHMINTPLQILLYEALGATLPEFAHLPMMLGADGEKLSKRHGAVTVGEYRDKGTPPERAPQLPRPLRLVVRRRGGLLARRADPEVRLGALRQGRRQVRREEVRRDQLRAPEAPGAHQRRGLRRGRAPVPRRSAASPTSPRERLLAGAPTVRERAQTFVEAADALDYFFREPPTLDEKAAKKFLVADKAAHLGALRERSPRPRSSRPSRSRRA